jgi:hypothetical protein
MVLPGVFVEATEEGLRAQYKMQKENQEYKALLDLKIPVIGTWVGFCFLFY